MPKNIRNFGGRDEPNYPYEKCVGVVLPISFDGTSTWGKGADKGPSAVLEAADNMELYDLETKSRVYDKGFFVAPEIKTKKTETMVKNGYEMAKKYLADGKFLFTLGGEHSISHGPIKAHAEKYPNLSVLHLDAHSDRRDEYHGTIYNHGCIIARAQEMVKTVVSVGVRSVHQSELERMGKDKIFLAEEIYDNDNWIKPAIKALTENVYITIDLDVFDPSIMPSTGTPEPGGMGWYQVLKLSRAVAKEKTIVGFDVVELAPNPENSAPDFLAAKLIYKLLSYIYGKN